MNRERKTMVLDILEVIRRTPNIKFTHIVYKANVNATVLKSILNELTAKNLISSSPLGRKITLTSHRKHLLYSLTKKGIDICKAHDAFNQTIEILMVPFVLEVEC